MIPLDIEMNSFFICRGPKSNCVMCISVAYISEKWFCRICNNSVNKVLYRYKKEPAFIIVIEGV